MTPMARSARLVNLPPNPLALAQRLEGRPGLALLSSGDHVVMAFDCYRRTREFGERFLGRWGIEAMGSTVNMSALWKATRSGGGQSGELPFDFDYTLAYLSQNWGILLAFTFISIGLTLFVLRRRDVH